MAECKHEWRKPYPQSMSYVCAKCEASAHEYVIGSTLAALAASEAREKGMREALEEIAAGCCVVRGRDVSRCANCAVCIARAALAASEQKGGE